MKKGTLLKRWIAVLCAMILTVSLFAIPAFADTTESSTGETDEVSTEESTEESAEESTEASTDEEETTGDGATDTDEDDDKGGLSTTTIVWLIVGAVILVIAVVLCIKFREKIKKFLRVYKSEAKKIVWLPWDQTKKSTLVVIVVLLICAAAICLLDFGLSKAILAFINLF